MSTTLPPPYPEAAAGSSSSLIQPKKYQIQRDGWNKGAWVWALPVETGQPPAADTSVGEDEKVGYGDEKAAIDELEQMAANPETLESTGKGKEEGKKKKFVAIDPSKVPAQYYIKRLKYAVYTLYKGHGPDDQYPDSKRLIDVNGEGLFSKNSSYTEVSGQCRHAKMYGKDGPDGVSLLSCDRTLQDFDGVTYRYQTKSPTWSDDIVIKRISDDTDIAYFDRLCSTSYSGLGTLDVKVPLKEDQFHLFLSAWYIKYQVDTDRRWGARS